MNFHNYFVQLQIRGKSGTARGNISQNHGAASRYDWVINSGPMKWMHIAHLDNEGKQKNAFLCTQT